MSSDGNLHTTRPRKRKPIKRKPSRQAIFTSRGEKESSSTARAGGRGRNQCPPHTTCKRLYNTFANPALLRNRRGSPLYPCSPHPQLCRCLSPHAPPFSCLFSLSFVPTAVYLHTRTSVLYQILFLFISPSSHPPLAPDLLHAVDHTHHRLLRKGDMVHREISSQVFAMHMMFSSQLKILEKRRLRSSYNTLGAWPQQ